MKSRIKLILGILLVLALAFLAWRMLRLLSVLLGFSGMETQVDPMFEVIPPMPTRPAEMDAEQTQPPHPTLDDYIPEIETPVDKTVDMLIDEAMAREKSEN